jgi:hypothetical protein
MDVSTGNPGAIRRAWRRLAASAERLPLLTGFEQSRLSWARRVESLDEVPLAYRDFFRAQTGHGAFPYCVLTPSFKGYLWPATQKLVYVHQDSLVILDTVKDELAATSCAIEDIGYVEAGTVLLNSWIKFSGVAGNGILTAAQIRFNTVTDYLFKPFLERIRRPLVEASGSNLQAEQAKFDYLSPVNFKFMNYARGTILPGEKVLAHILQPEVRKVLIRVLGRPFYRTTILAHISILTDRELVIIRDEESEVSGSSIRYGGVWTYVPLQKIVSVSLSEMTDDLILVSIGLPENDHVDSLFAASNRRELDRFLAVLKGLVAPAPFERVLTR